MQACTALTTHDGQAAAGFCTDGNLICLTGWNSRIKIFWAETDLKIDAMAQSELRWERARRFVRHTPVTVLHFGAAAKNRPGLLK